MNESKTYSLEQAHLHFAKSLNGEVWKLLQQPDRSGADDEGMIHAAHASAYHWLHAGAGAQQQRAQWLIAHVYTVLDLAEPALRHAERCLELTDQYASSLEDFDRAYAYEGLARANALAGNRDLAYKYFRLAEENGQAIQDDEDRRIFLDDFNSGDWYGLR